jgi:hypothetical protein
MDTPHPRQCGARVWLPSLDPTYPHHTRRAVRDVRRDGERSDDRLGRRLWENSSEFSSVSVSFAFSGSQTLQKRKNYEKFCSARSFAKFR